MIQDRLLEEHARLADGSRPKTSADGIRGVRKRRLGVPEDIDDLLRRRQLHCLDGHEDRVSTVAVSLDGTSDQQ